MTHQTVPIEVEILSAIRASGIIGAGGAGFPTHVKYKNHVDTIIANGAECEPLLHTDKVLMDRRPEDVVGGLRLAMEATSASTGIIGIKGKNTRAIESLKKAIGDKGDVHIHLLPNVYPVGDEQVLIKEVLGRTVPPGGLPFHAGVTVSNVLTLAQVKRASEGEPVTSRPVTVIGEVNTPIVLSVPIGTSFRDVIECAGGVTSAKTQIVTGGPVMGALADSDEPVTKVIGGIIVFPDDFPLVLKKRHLSRVTKYLAKMCYSCRNCTIICPRNAIGHPIHPDRIMTYSWNLDELVDRLESGRLTSHEKQMIAEAQLCCHCGLCELYACTFGLSADKIFAILDDHIIEHRDRLDSVTWELESDKMREYRQLSAATLSRRLGLSRYAKKDIDVIVEEHKPEVVKILLHQHIGAPALPVVSKGAKVECGDLIGEIPENTLSARIHASISGTVTEVNSEYITVQA